MNVNPLCFIRRMTPDLAVPKTSLPDRPITGLLPSSGYITFPSGDPIGDGDEGCGIFADEHVDVVRHDHVTTHGIIVVNIPGSA